MKNIRIWNDRPSDNQLDEICSVLSSGGMAIIPTDSIYAIVCDALSPKAIDRLCRLKGIDPDKSLLSIICSDISMASEYAKIENDTFHLLKKNTPGAFTFILRAASKLPKVFKGRKTVGIRIPANELCRALSYRMGKPLLSTSISFDSDDYAVNSSLIADSYDGQVDIMADAGDGGTIPSTIVDCTLDEPEIIRHGKGELDY